MEREAGLAAHEVRDLAGAAPGDHEWAVRRENELDARKRVAQRMNQVALPRGMEMRIDLVDDHDRPLARDLARIGLRGGVERREEVEDLQEDREHAQRALRGIAQRNRLGISLR